MYLIEREIKEGSEFPVYTREEADERDIDYVNWKEVSIDDWGLTDDGYVGRCLNIYEMEQENHIAYQIKYPFARPIVRYTKDQSTIVGNPRLEFLKYLETGGYNYSRPQTWSEREAKRRRTERAAWLWAQLFVIRGGRLSDEDWRFIGNTWRPDEKEPGKSARVLFRNDDIQRLATSKLIKIMSQSDVDVEYVIGKYKEFLGDQMEDGDPEITLETLRDLARMAGMNPEEIPEATGDDPMMDDFSDMTRDLEDAEEDVRPVSVGPNTEPSQISPPSEEAV